VRASTLQNGRTRLRYFVEWCDERGIENLNELSGRQLADFVSWRREQISAITLQKQLSTIRQFLEWCADIEAVETGLREKVHAPELPDGAESRDIAIDSERAKSIIEYLDRYQYASRRHVVMSLLWRTGMRRSALRAIDLDDLRPDDHAIVLNHRPETDTALKNGEPSERWVYLGPSWYQIVDDYISENRFDVTDEYGREPLVTTRYGRPTGSTIYDWVNRGTHPCEYGECPHDRDPTECEARGSDGSPSLCPSSLGPHAVRRGNITHLLNEDTTPEIVSERADVSLEVLYQHYDARSQREKMDVRKDHLPDQE
ncbi:MAG: tyrosine-type recombinase/integrase, partial [Halobacteriales archaeon]